MHLIYIRYAYLIFTSFKNIFKQLYVFIKSVISGDVLLYVSVTTDQMYTENLTKY